MACVYRFSVSEGKGPTRDTDIRDDRFCQESSFSTPPQNRIITHPQKLAPPARKAGGANFW